MENQGLCLSYPYHNVMEKRRPAVAALYGEYSNIDIVLDKEALWPHMTMNVMITVTGPAKAP